MRSLVQIYYNTEAYSEPFQISKMEHFAKLVNGSKLITIFAKRSLLDLSLGSEYASAILAM